MSSETSNYSGSDRTIYDEGSYLQKTKESNKPLSYMLNTGAHESCKLCGPKPNVTNHGERVDLESDLLGHTRKLTTDPSKKYQKDENIASTLNYNPPFLCERNLQSDKFLSNDTSNTYMEKLRGLEPKDVAVVGETSENMCKIQDFVNNQN